MGGFPYWLLHYYPDIKLRTSDGDYKNEVTIWYAKLLPRMQPLLYGNGGPIIMVQVENEYGSYPECDSAYMSWLAALTRRWVDQHAILFTTDWPHNKELQCGSTPDVYPTVDFGSGTNPSTAWKAMRNFTASGPLVNSEFYSGWTTRWSEDLASEDAESMVNTLKIMLDQRANVNFYMFHGGTNFEYTSGANHGWSYKADITSYDNDAPLDEAGDPTTKYFLIRDAVKEYMPLPDYPPPEVKPKGSLGVVSLMPALALLSPEGRNRMGRPPSRWLLPPTMEALAQRAGLTLYEAELPVDRTNPAPLTVSGIRDRALIYVDDEYVGVLSRSRQIYTIQILADQGNTVQILVENQGRINFGPMNKDFKGIVGNVTLSSQPILNWTVTSFPLEKSGLSEDDLEQSILVKSSAAKHLAVKVPGQWVKDVKTSGLLREGPVFYIAKFQLSESDPLDTYLDVTGWGKGFAWINDRHLGRYWPKERPQVTLYTPGVYLKKYPEWNIIVLLEMQAAPANGIIEFVSQPIFI